MPFLQDVSEAPRQHSPTDSGQSVFFFFLRTFSPPAGKSQKKKKKVTESGVTGKGSAGGEAACSDRPFPAPVSEELMKLGFALRKDGLLCNSKWVRILLTGAFAMV